MSWLLDTCVLSDFARGDRATLARLRATARREVAVSALTVHEVEYGLGRRPALSRPVRQAMRDLLGALEVIPFSQAEAQASAALRVALEKSGRPIGAYDVLIAGTALCRGRTLVTANVREFSRISGLAVENWRSTK